MAGERFYLWSNGCLRSAKLWTASYSGWKCSCDLSTSMCRPWIDDNDVWIACFTEAVQFCSGYVLWTLLITALMHGVMNSVSNQHLRWSEQTDAALYTHFTEFCWSWSWLWCLLDQSGAWRIWLSPIRLWHALSSSGLATHTPKKSAASGVRV